MFVHERLHKTTPASEGGRYNCVAAVRAAQLILAKPRASQAPVTM